MSDDHAPVTPDDTDASDGTDAVDSRPLAGVIARALEDQSLEWIAGQRWFGSKSRRIARVETRDVLHDGNAAPETGIALVALHYENAGTDQYALPYIVAPSSETSTAIARLTEHLSVIDGPPDRRFRTWFMDALEAGTTIESAGGLVRFEPTEALGTDLDRIRGGDSRIIRSEQSNSSLIYADVVIGKIFRRLQEGINPDLEIGRFFTEKTAFRAAPPVVGGVSYDRGGDEMSLAVLQQFVPSKGDDWTITLAELRDFVDGLLARGSRDLRDELIDAMPAAVLGRRTGEMHVALASSETEEPFAPEPVTPDDVGAWERSTISAIDANRVMLDRALPRLSPALQRAVVAADLSPSRLAHRLGGYRALEGTVRIRVHGDYHLGQILRTHEDDVVILDFEGEPSRDIDERRQKTAALKDVAGMLRSLRYARGAVTREYEPEAVQTLVDGWLAQWEAASRVAFLNAYRAVVTESPHVLVPEDNGDFGAALGAWELDKALYELAYEANNRPTWLDIPLMTLIS